MSLTAARTLLMLTQTLSGPTLRRYHGVSKQKEPKLPLTDEETSKLGSLCGKEKKNYIKELKSKYND